MHRIARTIAAALAVSLALATVPAAVASATTPPTTGSVLLELTTLAGKRLTSIDTKAHIGITADDSSFTGSAAPHSGPTDYRGRISRGAFTFKRIPAGVSFGVWGTDVGGAYLSASSGAHVVTAGKTLTVKLALAKGASVSGTIKNSKGKAVAGAIAVLLDGPTINDPGQPIARTNSKGQYTLQGIPSGSYTLEFNSRYAGLGSVTTNYGWSYWRSTTEALSTALVLNQQTLGSSATALTKRNGTVAPGHWITGTAYFDDLASTSSNEIQLRSTENNYDFTYGSVNAAHGFALRAIAGSYDLFVLHNGNYWYYTGDGEAPSLNPADAVPVTFSGTANLVVSMGVVGP